MYEATVTLVQRGLDQNTNSSKPQEIMIKLVLQHSCDVYLS